jgi:hypothetical protein
MSSGQPSRLGWRDAACLGVLMNTRGLMQLIALNIDLDLKVISPTLFAMLVIMALVTTLLPTPVLDALMLERWDQWPAGRRVGPQQRVHLSNINHAHGVTAAPTTQPQM